MSKSLYIRLRVLTLGHSILGIVLSGLFCLPSSLVATDAKSFTHDCKGELVTNLVIQKPEGFHDGFIVIVDPVFDGRFIAPGAWDRRYRPIYVFSRKKFIGGAESQFVPDNFVTGFHLKNANGADDYPSVLDGLKALPFPIAAVIAGSDTAPALAAQLAKDLELPGNDASLGELWTDKYLLGIKLAEGGVPSPETGLAQTAEQAWDWATTVHGRWPVIVKPRDATASFGVFLCHNLDDLKRAFKLIGTPHPRGGVFTELMVQEFIDPFPIVDGVHQEGAELHIVELSAQDGDYKVPYMEQYHLVPNKKQALTWDYVDMTVPHGEKADLLIATAIKAAKISGLTNGITHWEIFLKKVNGKWVAYFLDLGARTGGGMHTMTTLGTTHDIVQTNITAHVDKKAFDELPERFEQTAHVRHVGINVFEESMFLRPEAEVLAELKKLPSFKMYRPFGADGKKLEATSDLLSMAAWIFLAHPDKVQVEKDYEALLLMQERGVFYRATYFNRIPTTFQWGFVEFRRFPTASDLAVPGPERARTATPVYTGGFDSH